MMRTWLSNHLARLLQDHISRREAAAREAGHATGHALGRREGHQAGYSQGHTAGHIAGRLIGGEEGYQRGLDGGKWVIEDRRSRAAMLPLDASIYGPDRLPVTEGMKGAMRVQVADLAARGIVADPTPSQWEMIFSDHPATCVAAGAGSGKSTTLVLRVAFMLVHLGIPAEEITMVTFTRHAAGELRGKLLTTLLNWNYDKLDEKGAKKLVRTFHSVLYEMAQSAFPAYDFFDIVSSSDEGGDLENPLSSAQLKDIQLDTLKRAYRNLYHSNAEFRDHVAAMAKFVCDRDLGAEAGEDEVSSYLVEAASNRDENLTRLLNRRWAEHGLLPIDGIELGPFPEFKVKGREFFSNARVSNGGMAVFFGDMSRSQKLFGRDDIFPVPGRPKPVTPGQAIGVKKNVLSRHYGTQYLYLDSPKSIERLKLRILLGKTLIPLSAPDFDIRLQGELSDSSLPEAFYSQGSFIESLDLEVSSVVGHLQFREKNLEYHFCAALRLFWPFFEALLRNAEPKLMTFNRAFLQLAHDGAAKQALRLHHLRPLTHTLIDEFQDISPQIASWLKACQRKLAAAGRNPTIMAIGDDWQSVYGWRGSAPEFFINFDDHFPIHEDVAPAHRVTMGENHRSVEPIVRHAQELLTPVRNKVDKQVRAVKVAGAGEHGVVLSVGDVKKALDAHAAFIRNQLKIAREFEGGDKNKVIVLCRTNKLLNALRERLMNLPGLAFYTFHSAKGLQGETAIIFEDSEYGAVHVLRNIIYAQARTEKGERIFRQSYDQSMTDEAYRLAYVAVTRGMKRVFWFVEAQKHASRLLKPAEPKVAPISAR